MTPQARRGRVRSFSASSFSYLPIFLPRHQRKGDGRTRTSKWKTENDPSRSSAGMASVSLAAALREGHSPSGETPKGPVDDRDGSFSDPSKSSTFGIHHDSSGEKRAGKKFFSLFIFLPPHLLTSSPTQRRWTNPNIEVEDGERPVSVVSWDGERLARRSVEGRSFSFGRDARRPSGRPGRLVLRSGKEFHLRNPS